MFDKFLFAGLIMQIAWAACQVQIESSENAQATTKCKQNKCDVTINGNEYCSQCSKNDDHLVNGKCVAAAGDADKGCENPANGVCASCKDGYFMYKGGCYKFAGELGSLICADPESVAAAGKVAGACTNCVAGFFRSPVAAAGKQSCIACNDTTGADNNVGVANCAECTAPATSGSSGTAKCTGCAPGSDSKKPNTAGTSCVPCSPEHCVSCNNNNVCAACGDGYMLNAENACIPCTVAGCKACKSDGGSGQLCTACTSTSEKPNIAQTQCVSCGITDCTNCNEAGVCALCDPGSDSKKPNAAGNSCVPCNPAHCATCSAANICATCEDGYMLDAKKACVACTVAGCKRCESNGSTGQLCTACTSGTQKPNKEGTKCYECNINGCMYCSEVDTCDQCSDGFKLEGGKCTSSSANRSGLSTGAIAGISVAAVVVVGGLVGFLCWWFICRGKA